jgi:type II secretion system protein J
MRTRQHFDGRARHFARAASSVGTPNRRARSYAPYQAFTLIEILIAVAAFAIVLAAINTIYYTALRLRNSTTAAIEKGLPLEHAFSVIKRDLSGLVVPGKTIFGAFSTVSTSNNVSGQIGPSFHTTTGVIDETSPFAEVQRVSYLLVASTNQSNGRDLYRAVSRNLLPALQDQTEQEWLLGGVETVTFLYHDGSQWRESWDATVVNTTTGLSNGLPAAVKMQVQLANEDGAVSRSSRSRELPVELVVPIQVQQRTNQTEQATTTTAQAGGGQ